MRPGRCVMSDEATSVPRIVVGVDGSEPSKAALRWAVDQAKLTGGVVDAIIAWEFPTAWYGLAPPTDKDPADYQKQARISWIRRSTRPSARARDGPSTSAPSRPTDTRPPSCSMPPREHSCWSWATEGTADSARHCWGRSALRAARPVPRRRGPRLRPRSLNSARRTSPYACGPLPAQSGVVRGVGLACAGRVTVDRGGTRVAVPQTVCSDDEGDEGAFVR